MSFTFANRVQRKNKRNSEITTSIIIIRIRTPPGQSPGQFAAEEAATSNDDRLLALASQSIQMLEIIDLQP